MTSRQNAAQQASEAPGADITKTLLSTEILLRKAADVLREARHNIEHLRNSLVDKSIESIDHKLRGRK